MMALRCSCRRLGFTRACSTTASTPAVTLTEEAGGIRVITLNRPKVLNAMTVELGDAVTAAVEGLRHLPPNDLRAVVVTGAGRAFSAGGDLGFLNARKADTPTNNASTMLGFYARFLAIRQLPVPVIACINGPAIGAGLCFAMGADVRYTHEEASLGFTFVGLGLHPGMGCTHTLLHAAGSQVANRMLFSGEVVKGKEAQALGLVLEALPTADAALERSLALARQISRQSPMAVRNTVKTLRASTDLGLDAALMRESDAQAQSYATADYAEGLAALSEKRKPSFKGC